MIEKDFHNLFDVILKHDALMLNSLLLCNFLLIKSDERAIAAREIVRIFLVNWH